MSVYVAFLRAINVGGRVVKMDVLRRLCEGCGLDDVETFIASGNIILTSRSAAASLEKKLEKAFRAGLGYDVPTFVRSLPELASVVRTAAARAAGARTTYVGFLKTRPAADRQERIAAQAGPTERFEFVGREIYWFTDGGMSDSKFSNAVLERIIESPATFRNVTTTQRLVEKYS